MVEEFQDIVSKVFQMMLIILCVCEKRRKIHYSQIILSEIVSVKCCLMGSHRFILL